jgi:hypothetical protein
VRFVKLITPNVNLERRENGAGLGIQPENLVGKTGRHVESAGLLTYSCCSMLPVFATLARTDYQGREREPGG